MKWPTGKRPKLAPVFEERHGAVAAVAEVKAPLDQAATGCSVVPLKFSEERKRRGAHL